MTRLDLYCQGIIIADLKKSRLFFRTKLYHSLKLLPHSIGHDLGIWTSPDLNEMWDDIADMATWPMG
jgi:hypothetical protein